MGCGNRSIPSRFLDELPEAHVEVREENADYGGYGGGAYGASRFDARDPFANTYATPGWQRAQKNREKAGGGGGKRGFDSPLASGPRLIEGELVAKSVIGGTSDYAVGERVFHQKFGYGRIGSIDGNKLTIDFDKAGQKRVLDSSWSGTDPFEGRLRRPPQDEALMVRSAPKARFEPQGSQGGAGRPATGHAVSGRPTNRRNSPSSCTARPRRNSAARYRPLAP